MTDEFDDVALEDDGVLDGSDSLLGGPGYDPLDEGLAPPDHWSPAERFGTTAAEARAGETLDMLLAEEEPEGDPGRTADRGTVPLPAELAALHLLDEDGLG